MAQTSLLLALDQGTSSSRCLAFNLKGKVIAKEQKLLKNQFPKPGWVEQDPEDIFDGQLAALRGCLKQLGARHKRIAAVGLTNQRETTIIWDRKTGQAIGPALVWQDRRTATQCENWSKITGAQEMLLQRNGLIFDAYFSGSKIAWLLEHTPGARRRAEAGELAFGTVDSWLTYRFSDGRDHITDVTNASRSMLFNLKTCNWDKTLLEFFSIPRELLPRIVPSSGHLSTIATKFTGLKRELPICGIAGDQQAALFGQRCFEAGEAKVTYGTGAFLLLNLGKTLKFSKDRLLTTIAWQLHGEEPVYAYEGSVFVAGAAVQWLRDELGMILNAEEIEALARSTPDNGGVYFVPSFTGLGAPYWDGFAKGQLMGLCRSSTRAQIARATLEGIAHQISDVFSVMGPTRAIRADGGAAANDLLLEIQADQLNVPLIRPENLEATAWGAALLAALGCGIFKSLQEVKDLNSEDTYFVPKSSRARIEHERKVWARAIECTRLWQQEVKS